MLEIFFYDLKKKKIPLEIFFFVLKGSETYAK